jgi:penicillin-binding protein 1A
VIADTREQIVDPAVAYQMVSMLQGVVDRGTGASIREVGKTLGGKTGTSDESKDTWFVGFSADLAVGVFVGFDHPKSLGKTEQGASTAAPIFKDFMAAALAETPDVPFRIPAGVRLVRVDAESGLPARVGSGKTILEAFRPGSEPTDNMATLDGPMGTSAEGNEGGGDSSRSVFRPAATPVTGSAVTGTGGLY